MGSEIIINLKTRPPIPPRSRIPTGPISIRKQQQQELSPLNGLGFRRLKPSSLPSYLDRSGSPSQMSSDISLNTHTTAQTTANNKNKTAIYKRIHGQQQRIQQEQQHHFCQSYQVQNPQQQQQSSPSIMVSNPSSLNKSLQLLPPSSLLLSSSSSSQSLSRPRISSLSVAELATRFLEENVRNYCIKPRIFPVFPFLSFYYFFMQYNFS